MDAIFLKVGGLRLVSRIGTKAKDNSKETKMKGS